MLGDLQQDVDELFSRVDACESRQNAVDMRQARIERLLMAQQTQLQSQAKMFTALNDRMQALVEAVLALAPKPPNGSF